MGTSSSPSRALSPGWSSTDAQRRWPGAGSMRLGWPRPAPPWSSGCASRLVAWGWSRRDSGSSGSGLGPRAWVPTRSRTQWPMRWGAHRHRRAPIQRARGRAPRSHQPLAMCTPPHSSAGVHRAGAGRRHARCHPVCAPAPGALGGDADGRDAGRRRHAGVPGGCAGAPRHGPLRRQPGAGGIEREGGRGRAASPGVYLMEPAGKPHTSRGVCSTCEPLYEANPRVLRAAPSPLHPPAPCAVAGAGGGAETGGVPPVLPAPYLAPHHPPPGGEMGAERRG